MNTPVFTCDTPTAIPTKPEWVRIPEAVRIFGIGRSTLYVLMAEGKVNSRLLRRRGAVRGIRLVSYDSLCAFVNAQPTAIGEFSNPSKS